MRAMILGLALFFVLFSCSSTVDGGMTIRLDVSGQRVEGHPLAWTSNNAYLLRRDGSLFDFHPNSATNMVKVADRFYSYNQNEMRATLAREFGKRFDVSGTGHYLVVHPAGQRDQWAQRFEDLYRSFVHYFSSRGFRTQNPMFPMVAVVFHQQNDFARFAARDGVRASAGLLGYYSPTTNRVILYDVTGGRGDPRRWYQNADTIIHEATHQTAFNTGIHTRFGTTPRWLAEGLGTLFEAPGVWNSRSYPQRAHRINRGRLESFRRYAATRRRPGATTSMLGDDRLFKTDATAAYAEAWALTFFLSELEPHKYSQYLRKTASRAPFEKYPSARRQKDFTDIFGTDLVMLEARMLRFLGEQK